MKSERFWVLILAVTVFCAGLAAGMLLSFRRQPAQSTGPFADYEARMIETFGLDEEHARNLRWILQDYQEKIDALKDENLVALYPRLERIGLQHRDLILEKVVPEHRRQEFKQWADDGVQLHSSSAEPQ